MQERCLLQSLACGQHSINISYCSQFKKTQQSSTKYGVKEKKKKTTELEIRLKQTTCKQSLFDNSWCVCMHIHKYTLRHFLMWTPRLMPLVLFLSLHYIYTIPIKQNMLYFSFQRNIEWQVVANDKNKHVLSLMTFLFFFLDDCFNLNN